MDNGSSADGVVGLCGIAATLFITPYVSGQNNGYCLANDIDGNPNVGVGTNAEADRRLFSLCRSSARYRQPYIQVGLSEVGISPVRAASRTLRLARRHQVMSSYTRPVAYIRLGIPLPISLFLVIPANTTITAIWPSHLRLSNNLTGSGVRVGDKIKISGNGSCFNFLPGLNAAGAYGLQFSTSCISNEYAIQPNGYFNSWDIAGVHYPLGNYLGYNTGVPVFQGGLQVGATTARITLVRNG